MWKITVSKKKKKKKKLVKLYKNILHSKSYQNGFQQFFKAWTKKAILFWYDTNAKGKKYGKNKNLTLEEFGGNCYLQNGNWTRTMLSNYDKKSNGKEQ